MTNKIKLGLWIPPKIKTQMQELADKERWSLSKLGEVAIEYYLKLRQPKSEKETSL